MNSIKLWEVKHPYYCSEGNFFAQGYYTRHDSWAEFYECMGDSDVDLNLLFRWDWKRYEAEDGEPARETFQAFFVGQRKGLFFSHECYVTPEDEPAVRAWLLTRLPTILALWAPLVNESLAPVVGAEDGEHARNDYPLPVATAEPGPGGTDDDPGRASTEETTS